MRVSSPILRLEPMPCPRHGRTGTYPTAGVGQLRAVLMGSSRVSLQPKQDRVYLGKGCPMRLRSVGLSRQLRLPCLYGYNPKSAQRIRLDLNPTLGFVHEWVCRNDGQPGCFFDGLDCWIIRPALLDFFGNRGRDNDFITCDFQQTEQVATRQENERRSIDGRLFSHALVPVPMRRYPLRRHPLARVPGP